MSSSRIQNDREQAAGDAGVGHVVLLEDDHSEDNLLSTAFNPSTFEYQTRNSTSNSSDRIPSVFDEVARSVGRLAGMYYPEENSRQYRRVPIRDAQELGEFVDDEDPELGFDDHYDRKPLAKVIGGKAKVDKSRGICIVLAVVAIFYTTYLCCSLSTRSQKHYVEDKPIIITPVRPETKPPIAGVVKEEKYVPPPPTLINTGPKEFAKVAYGFDNDDEISFGCVSGIVTDAELTMDFVESEFLPVECVNRDPDVLVLGPKDQYRIEGLDEELELLGQGLTAFVYRLSDVPFNDGARYDLAIKFTKLFQPGQDGKREDLPEKRKQTRRQSLEIDRYWAHIMSQPGTGHQSMGPFKPVRFIRALSEFTAVSVDGENAYMVMEYFDGDAMYSTTKRDDKAKNLFLDECMKSMAVPRSRWNKYDDEKSLRVFGYQVQQSYIGLVELRDHDIVHGDLKHDNIMLDWNWVKSGCPDFEPGHLKYVDYGFSVKIGARHHAGNGFAAPRLVLGGNRGLALASDDEHQWFVMQMRLCIYGGILGRDKMDYLANKWKAKTFKKLKVDEKHALARELYCNLFCRQTLPAIEKWAKKELINEDRYGTVVCSDNNRRNLWETFVWIAGKFWEAPVGDSLDDNAELGDGWGCDGPFPYERELRQNESQYTSSYHGR